MRAARKDGVLSGVLSTRTDGLVRLPKRFRGNPEIIAALELGHDQTRSVFDEMCPPAELGMLAADGVQLHDRDQVRRLLESLELWSPPLPVHPARAPPEPLEVLDFP